MGRTLPSATQIFLQEEAAFARFRRALRRSDHGRVTHVTRTADAGLRPARLVALDDLFAAAKQHTAAAQYASHALPFEVFLLSMLLEEHKETRKLRDQVDSVLMRHGNNQTISEKVLRLNNTRSGFIDPGFGVDDNPEDDLKSVAG